VTKDQAIAVIKILQRPNFVPFVLVAAGLAGIPRAVISSAMARGNAGNGTKLENTFAITVNKIVAQYVENAMAIVTSPNLTNSEKTRASQLMQLVNRLDRETFSTSEAKTRAPEPPAEDLENEESLDIKQVMAQLENAAQEDQEETDGNSTVHPD